MSLQDQLFADLHNQQLFGQSQEYARSYIDDILDRNIYPTEEALQDLSQFDEPMPEGFTPADQVLLKLHHYGSPATTATLGGRYFGFVIGSAVPVGIAAKQLATVWDQAPAMHVLSPIASQLESVVEKWLIELFDLPQESAAGFVSGTSSANLCGLAAARYRLLQNQNWDVNRQGLKHSPDIRVIACRQAHSTVLKAISILGLGLDAIEWVEVDEQGRILEDEIPVLDNSCLLILQAGNVNTGAFDPFESICQKAQQAGAWVHIDGAFGLWAGAVQQLSHLMRGANLATSWSVDGHKTLNTPYDCGIVLCRDGEALGAALHMSGSYIIESEERDGMFYTPEMSRRARVIELWAIMKQLGKSGIDEMVLTLHLRAKQFEEELKAIEGFNIENDVVFNQVLVSCESDMLTEKVLMTLQSMREIWLGGSFWRDKKVMRLSICSWATTKDDITTAVESFQKALSFVKEELTH